MIVTFEIQCDIGEKNLGLSQIGWLRLEFGPAFEGSQLLAGCSAVEAKFGLFKKAGKVGTECRCIG